MARGYTLRAGLYQQPKDFQPIVLGKRGKRRDGIYRFHISTNIEILIKGQAVATAIEDVLAEDVKLRSGFRHAQTSRSLSVLKATIVADRAEPGR
jgi:hypothetical protein